MLRFSIVTINYNDEIGLKNSIISLANQGYKNFEFIVIDGGSKDGSIGVIKDNNDLIDYWVSEPDKGVYDAMNKGLQKCKGEFIYFLNSGDTFYSDNVLQDINEEIIKNEPKIIFGNINDISEETGISKIRLKQKLNKINLFDKMVCHQALFCKRTLFENNAFNLDYKIKADYDWLLRTMFTNPKIVNTNIVVANYMLGGLSATQYNTYSKKEIPKIRDTYFSKKEQKALRKYVFNPKVIKLPFGNFIKRNLIQYVEYKYPNLR
ncbi:glycosyltransferase (GT2) [Formosa agariphila KMM 3901]|uniref:Glycosyltransferase (GT2) n=1 Tax=Formosa agariphila (strain DSM 15362 / KCTC 12365 / LMG 23005 / KMM 3901 / M-2Alg 35-1) TaxID=1347342 RepID=T2KRJ5_FORAG|nr:glycosyltransferase family 2 protein [Formosa agariphila]CDF80639.1 glycosyltransferase (GT2) [Formosa agariphila KMM 3901]